jgi:hypothetical protein
MAAKLGAAVGVPAATLLPSGGGGGGGGAGGAGGGAAAGAASGKPIAAIVGALIAGGAIGVTISELRPRDTAPAIVAVVDAATPAIDAMPDASAIDAPIIDARADVIDARRASTPRPDAPSAAAADDLARERELIDIARAALRRGDHRLADKHLIEHAMRFPRGALVEEQRVLAIELALAKGDRAGAEARAAAFRRDFPRSVFLRRVDELIP